MSVRVTTQIQVLPGPGTPLGHLLYLPPGYDGERGEGWPLLLFLHGAGERGSRPAMVARHGPPKLIETGRDLPFIVLSPQCPAGQYWEPSLLCRLLDDVQSRLAVDPERVYVTGMSMGGYGTWMLLAHQPDRFAAAALVCGGGNPRHASLIRDLPVWLIHGEQDDVVPVAQSLLLSGALEEAGGHVRLTIYPDAGHDAWTRAYDTPELYAWFLRHRRDRGRPEKP